MTIIINILYSGSHKTGLRTHRPVKEGEVNQNNLSKTFASNNMDEQGYKQC